MQKLSILPIDIAKNRYILPTASTSDSMWSLAELSSAMPYYIKKCRGENRHSCCMFPPSFSALIKWWRPQRSMGEHGLYSCVLLLLKSTKCNVYDSATFKMSTVHRTLYSICRDGGKFICKAYCHLNFFSLTACLFWAVFRNRILFFGYGFG
jgi:hypothetical protein